MISQYSCLALAQCLCDHDAFLFFNSGAAKVVVEGYIVVEGAGVLGNDIEILAQRGECFAVNRMCMTY